MADEQDLERRAAWQQAVSKLEVQFEADHGGGFPECLKGLTPDQRVRSLRDLGFRVKEFFHVNTALDFEPPRYESWVRISGGISVNLDDGWVSSRERSLRNV